MKIGAQALTVEAFAPFGQVIDLQGRRPQAINDGNTLKFADLAGLFSLEGAAFSVHLYRSRAAQVPITISNLECHELGHQAFIPLHAHPFPVVVAEAGPSPDSARVHAFLSNGRQGINLAPGTWHHYQLSLVDDCEYLVIERANAGNDCRVCQLDRPLILDLAASPA